MNIVQQEITVTTAPVRLATSYTPCCKIFAQMKEGGTGVGWVGTSTMSNAGANSILTLDAATATAPGSSAAIETQDGWNSLDAAQYYVHGATAGDKIEVTYHQA